MNLLKRLIIRFFGLRKTAPLGKINPNAFNEKIGHYKKLGTKIGNKVRLIGIIDGTNPHLVSVGDYSVIGFNSVLLAHCPIKGAAKCTIGNYVYIAAGVLVLPGVTIEDYCVIGAGAVVTKNIPSGSIVAGNPARVIRKMTEEEKARIIDTMHNDKIFGWSLRE